MIVEVFGKRIQTYLRSSGYSQKELAAAIGIHHKVLSRKLHGAASSYFSYREIHDLIIALANWQAISRREDLLNLFAEAGIDTSAIFRAAEWLEPPLNTLNQQLSSPVPTDAPAPQHNIPAPLGQLIGRSWAVTRLMRLLGNAETRLVTLIGPGGSGKTRLALHVAHELVETFAQGVWFVSFTGLSDPAMVPLAIAQGLNIKSAPDQNPLHTISSYLSQRQMLLVLDNFEHVGEASGAVEDLLAAAPGLKVLITSRIVLHLPGEHEFSVPPLDLPDPTLASGMGVAVLMDYSAIQLFIERAQAVLPDFIVTSENGSAIAQICASVDGLPLALELAAARIKILTPITLLERLSQARLPLLTRVGKLPSKQVSSRHQTLSNTIKWSYDLLDPDEQKWFRRLGVFLGSWSLESSETLINEITAAEKRSATVFEPLDLLTQLVNNSLLARVDDAHGHTRFTMLSTLREYALARLEAHGETEWLHDWHACYFLRKAEKGELGLRGPRQLTLLIRLTDARANLRAALEWSLQKARQGKRIHAFPPANGLPQEVAGCRTLSQQPFSSEGISAHESILRLATAMRAYWEWQGLLAEARHWLNAALELPVDDGAAPTLLAARARAFSESARLMVLQNSQERALELADESIALWRPLDDAPGLASALFHRGWALHGKGEYAAARETYHEALELLSPTRDTWLYAQILLCLAAIAGFTSDYELARLYYARCRELFEQVGDKAAVADAWKDQGAILLIAGDLDEAIACLLTSIQICRELDHKQYIATALGSLSFAFGLREVPDAETASLNSAQVQGAAESLMATIGLTPWTNTTPFIQAVRQYIRVRVDDERWQAAFDTGHALTLEQALELVVRLAQLPPNGN
jgi:predicted ATPase/transcriptional regulator with XRE-family HTH domain